MMESSIYTMFKNITFHVIVMNGLRLQVMAEMHLVVLYGKSGIESGQEMPKVVCDKGEYCFTVNALGISDLWNERTVKLFITVK